MTIDPPVNRVVIAGGGLAGWSAAATLKRRIPLLDVEIVASSPPTDSIADRIISTLPSIMDFHSDLGLTEADTIVRAQSGLRAGTIFEDWSVARPFYVHAYGNYGQAIDGTAFHQQWLRAHRSSDVEPFDRFSPAAELGRAARVASAAPNAAAMAPQVGYGLHLTLERYRQLMRAYALHLGVVERVGEFSGLKLRGQDKFVDKLLLGDGTEVGADLFVDCTGPAAQIRSRLAGEFVGWDEWLRCDRIVFATAAPRSDVQVLDRVKAVKWGWQWSASSPALSSVGAAYSSRHAAFCDVVESLPAECRSAAVEVTIRQGRWAQPWAGNCVAVGEASTVIEPLEWTNLHLVHNQLDRLVAMLAGRDCAAVELAEYNRQCSAEADRIRDFVCLHYVASRRDEPFWKEAAAVEPPETLGHTLSLFAERGRLPYYEEETFAKDSWLAVLLGQGFEPRRTDPLADIVPSDRALRSILTYRDSVRAFVQAQPGYQQAMSNLGPKA